MATIEIDGQTVEVGNDKTIIEVADDLGIHIPRFCYHKKLSVAANCRMCLVEVSNSRKTVPACATPVADGMKVFTQSKATIESQKTVMDFLLINHPLDCPICDQGGECELQDLSVGFGRDASSYTEGKRSVADENLGSLVATEMTRCIHCTRCVRFGDEIAGVRELGALGRGENMQISTGVAHSLKSEVSGNIIDLCPVGALTSKPYRFQARAWEMSQHATIAPHDCLGSHIYAHVRRNQIMRVVPQECDDINEIWLSDRDRFSYLGMLDKTRAQKPQIKRNGQWEAVDWQTALDFAAQGMARVIKQHGPEQCAAFASPSSTLEELYLLQKVMRGLGVENLDYRLHATDFRDQTNAPTLPTSSLRYADLESQTEIVLLGCHVHREIPLAGLRIRKAYQNGAHVYAINPIDHIYPFELSGKAIVSPKAYPNIVAQLLLAVTPDTKVLPEEVQHWLENIEIDPSLKPMITALSKKGEGKVIVLGEMISNHPDAAILRTLLFCLRAQTGVSILEFTHGANAVGAALVGMLPHRMAFGQHNPNPGLDVRAAIDAKLRGYLLMHAEPGFDFAFPAKAREAMVGADFVVVLSAFDDEHIREYADVILPIAPFTETSGTYINIDHTWQTVQGAHKPYEEARPAWKILRVLANILMLDGFEYASSEEVLDEIRNHAGHMSHEEYTPFYVKSLPTYKDRLVRLGEWSLYRVDPIVRRAYALQESASANPIAVSVHPETAEQLRLKDTAVISQGSIEITLPLIRDVRVAQDVICVPNGLSETVDLGATFGAISIKRER